MGWMVSTGSTVSMWFPCGFHNMVSMWFPHGLWCFWVSMLSTELLSSLDGFWGCHGFHSMVRMIAMDTSIGDCHGFYGIHGFYDGYDGYDISFHEFLLSLSQTGHQPPFHPAQHRFLWSRTCQLDWPATLNPKQKDVAPPIWPVRLL